jgi:hypothetical protein
VVSVQSRTLGFRKEEKTVAAKKSIKPVPEAEGFLATAARTVGHAAGEAAKAIGVQAGEASSEAPAKGPKREKVKTKSARGKRAGRAAAAKKAVEALGKVPIDDVRYRRIMGKTPAIWSQEDIEYIDGLVAAHGQAAGT